MSIKERNTEIAELQNHIANLNSTNTQLQTSKRTVEKEYANCLVTIQTLEKEKQDLQTQFDDLIYGVPLMKTEVETRVLQPTNLPYDTPGSSKNN